MDFQSLVNKDGFKTILLHHLKSQVRSKFGNAISSKIQEHIEKDESLSSDNLVTVLSSSISESKEFQSLLKSYIGNLNVLFSDKESFVPKDEKLGSDSQCSSASSMNISSIDFLSPHQFQNITQSLLNGIFVEKLEAIETLCRLPALEHIIKPTLWPEIESGLQNALSSNVVLIKDASLKLYSKMLSSSEPKVVQESYTSLIKFFLHKLLPLLNQNNTDPYFMYKCKCAVEVIAILNKFLQNISSHWLRYPQSVIEEITVLSLSILSHSCKHSSHFPTWICVALCDPKAKWLKNILFGHISRGFLLSALERDFQMLQFAVKFCEKFACADDYLALKDKCCQKSALVAEITHIICFLSHILQYYQGREIFAYVSQGTLSPCWMNALNLVMKCTQKLCCITCFNCCAVVCEIVSKKWTCFWDGDISVTGNSLIEMLIFPNCDIGCTAVSSIYFTMQCLCEAFDSFYNVSDNLPIGKVDHFICALLKHCIDFYFINSDLNQVPMCVLKILISCLCLVKKILSTPSTFFLKGQFNEVLKIWWLKTNDFCKKNSIINNCDLASSHHNEVSSELEHKMSVLHMCFLEKPFGIQILHNAEYLEISLHVLLEKMLADLKQKNSLCPRDSSLLSTALNSSFSLTSILNKSLLFKLSSIIWQANEMENLLNYSLSSIKPILEILVPSMFTELTTNEMLVDTNFDNPSHLFEYVLLFPNLTTHDCIPHEDYNILALQVISSLTSSVQSVCILQAKFMLTEMLFELQSQHVNNDGILITDPITILVNLILVKMYAVGGPEEKVLPPEFLENSIEYNWPFIESYPLPEIYYHELSLDNNFNMNFCITEIHQVNLQKVFLKCIQSNKQLTPDFLLHLLKCNLKLLTADLDFSKTLNFVTLDSPSEIVLEDEILYGILLTNRYGSILKLTSADDSWKLEKLLKAVKCFFGIENYVKFDTFVNTIYLIFKADLEACWLFLETFATSKNSLFIWFERLLQAKYHDSQKYTTFYCAMLEQIDIIVKRTLPLVFNAFKLCGISPSVIFNHWTNQCYWNYLDFIEIAQFLLMSIIYSGDFVIYFFVSILKHLQPVILKHAHDCDIFRILKKMPVYNYKLFNYIQFIIELSDCFHDSVSETVMDILTEKMT